MNSDIENDRRKDFMDALKEVTSTIKKCETSQVKFEIGTSQHTLLRNRIKAMRISKLLIENEISRIEHVAVSQANLEENVLELDENNIMTQYTKNDLTEALPPVLSVIHKCEKAQSKFEEGTTNYNRFMKLIKAMYASKSLIEKQLTR